MLFSVLFFSCWSIKTFASSWFLIQSIISQAVNFKACRANHSWLPVIILMLTMSLISFFFSFFFYSRFYCTVQSHLLGSGSKEGQCHPANSGHKLPMPGFLIHRSVWTWSMMTSPCHTQLRRRLCFVSFDLACSDSWSWGWVAQGFMRFSSISLLSSGTERWRRKW